MISVRQAIDLLDKNFSELAQYVAKGHYAFWLGSGISRDRVDDLKGIIQRVLAFLQTKIDPSRTDCRYRRALNEVIACARLSPAEYAGIDYAQTVDRWVSLDTILSRLIDEYAKLLDVRVEGEPDDYLLWEAVDVVNTFTSSGAIPDCEHLCIAILVMEGVLPDIASANWDGLIEAAVDELSGASGTALRVCVRANDLREPRLLSRLLKFHGCAVQAGRDPANYRQLLIARQSQISDWQNNDDYSAVRHALVALAVEKPTLMIGLSSQDTNIQDIFLAGKKTMEWVWPSCPPAHVFAEDELGDAQRNLLKCVYRTAYTSNGAVIEASARFKAYGKPLLTALVLHVLCAKLCFFARSSIAPKLSNSDRDELEKGIIAIRDRLAIAAEPDRYAFVRELVASMTRILALFQDGVFSAIDPYTYHAFSNCPVHMISADPNLSTNGLRELASALGVIGLGEVNTLWDVAPGDRSDPTDGAIRISSAGRTARVFFAANGGAAMQLLSNGIVAPNANDAVIIHSTVPARRMTRSPHGTRGRTGRVGIRNVVMPELLLQATDLAHLQQRFREEAVI